MENKHIPLVHMRNKQFRTGIGRKILQQSIKKIQSEIYQPSVRIIIVQKRMALTRNEGVEKRWAGSRIVVWLAVFPFAGDILYSQIRDAAFTRKHFFSLFFIKTECSY